MQTDPISIIFSIVGGLALFMFGITMLRENLGKVSGSQIAKILEKTTDNPIKGMATGAGATLMTQSSSITVLTLIGFVNAGLMTFRQSVHVMLGSEIGTTITAQLVSFDVGVAFWPMVAIGFGLKMFGRREKIQLLGSIIFSLGLIFLAMDFMKEGAKPLGESAEFVGLLSNFNANPLIGILIGTLIAGITQSSSATTSLVIALGGSNVIGLEIGITAVLGANIGTCFLELAAGVGATTPAKRTALAQVLINILGVVFFLPIIGPFTEFIRLTDPTLQRQIANGHTIFNVIVSFIFIPLVGVLVKICEKVIPEKEGEIIGAQYFDENMLKFPQIALQEAEKEILKAADLTLEMIELSKAGLSKHDLKAARKVLKLEDEIDKICANSESFIDKIPEKALNAKDKMWRMKLLAIIVDIERVGDLANNLGEFAFTVSNGTVTLSEFGKKEIEEMFDLAYETYSKAIRAMREKDQTIAKIAIDLEDQIDILEKQLKMNHLKRMKEGICSPSADAIFVETLRNLERIGDHADNIALDVLASYEH